MKADDGLRKLLHTHLPRSAGFLWTAVETGGTHNGVPDSHWVNANTRSSGWIESKATDGWAVEVRPHQVSWIVPRVAAGERVTIAIRAKGKGSADGRGDSLWLVRGSAVKELQELGLKLPGWAILGIWYGPPKEWDWAAVSAIITG
jgi:hypothetical protein